MDIREYQECMDNALGEVKRLLVRSGYCDAQTLEYIDCDRDDPDDMQRWNELMDASKALMQVVNNLGYIHRQIVGTSQLHLNASGRYEDDFYEYTSGSGIEFLLVENCSTPRWVHSCVESDVDGKYYIVGYRGLNMDGLETRVRK